MLIKIHESCRLTIAICDSDLIDKKFEEGIKQLDLTGSFFKGEEKTEQEATEIIEDSQKEDATFNIVGKQSCDLALKLGIVEKSGIITIQDIPIALVLL